MRLLSLSVERRFGILRFPILKEDSNGRGVQVVVLACPKAPEKNTQENQGDTEADSD